ncbi:MAG: PglZ domain-containing protein, partial [Tissierellia bacterium]|nr:PglZ domain-containing protein [Tissierellia bacterium]
NIYRKLLNSNNEYLEELNLELIKKEKQLYLFNSLDNNFSNFISRVTGVLKHEFNFVIEFIIHKISNKDFMDIEKVEALIFKTETKFEYLIYQDNRAKKTIYLLKNLINKIKTLNSMEKEMGNLVTIEKWFDFYTTKYMIIKNDLDKDNNIYEIIDNIVEDNRIRISLKQRVNLIIDKINKQYETFLYNNFDNIHRQNMGKYSILSALSKISKYSNEKTVLLVIDAMRWDIWEIAQNILEGHGYVQENKDDFLVAMIPTITSISRLSLFSGNKYKTIIDEKMNNVYEYDYRDESKHLKRFFKGKKVGFTIGGKEKFNRLMDKDLDIYAFIYSESDAVLHGLTDINKDIIYYILKEQIDNIIKEVENRFDDKFNIVVTTDHGTIDIKNSKGIYLENTVTSYLKNYSINYSNHGKYIRIFSMDSIDKENYDEIHSYFKDLDYFHIITIEDMTKYYLPKKEKDEYNLFYLICKYKYHIGSTTRSTNTHGGFSMNETLIPFAVFQKELENIKELDIVIISNLVYKTNSKLTIKVINPNDFNIRNINLSIKPFINKYKIDFIKRESSIEFEINIIPEVHGTVDLNTTIDYEKLGREIHETKTIQIDVKEDLKTRISKDIKKSRRLDF